MAAIAQHGAENVAVLVQGQMTKADATIALVDAAFPKESWEVRFWPACARLRPHAEAALAAAQDLPIGACHTSRLLILLARYLYSQGSYPAAEPLYQRALAIDGKTLGPEHPDVAIICNSLSALAAAHLQDGGP